MTAYQGEASWILGHRHCALSNWSWSHLPLYWVKCNLTSRVRISCPCSQKTKWRFLCCRALIEQQLEFPWHQQKLTNEQHYEAFKRAVALMKQLNRQLRSTWIHSAYIKKTRQPQFPLDVDLPLSLRGRERMGNLSYMWAVCSMAVVNCTINWKGHYHNSHLCMWLFFSSNYNSHHQKEKHGARIQHALLPRKDPYR